MHKIKKHTFIFIIFLIGIVLSNCSKQNVCNKDSSETSTCSGISSRNIGGSGSNPSGGTYPIQQVITASVSTKNIQAQLGIPIYFTINFKTSTSTATNLEVKSSDVNWTIDNTSCKLVTTDNDDCLIKFTSTPTALTNPENKPVNLPISYTYIGDDNKSYSGSIADVTYEVFSSAPTSQVTAIISSLNNMSQVGVPFSFNIKFNTKTKATNLKVILTDNNWTQSMTNGCKLINNSGNCRVTFTNQASVATTPSNTPVNLPISYSFLGDDNNQHSESITGINYEIDSPSAPPSISQVNVTVSVGDTIAKGIRIQQGAIVPSFTFTFSVTAGSVTNLKVQSSDTNLVIPANSNTCLALTPSSESCALTFNYNPKDLISPIIFPLTFSYKDGSTSYTKTLNGFTYEVVSSPIAAVNISHGRINTLTLNASNDILVNSDKSSQEPTLPSNYLSELKSDLTPGSDTYPSSNTANKGISYSNPLITSGKVVYKQSLGNSSDATHCNFIFRLSSFVQSWWGTTAEQTGCEAPVLEGFKTAPISAEQEGSYYITTIDDFGTTVLKPYILKIDNTKMYEWAVALDPLADNTQIANAASSPVVLNNSIYFKSNYKLKTPQTPTPSQEIYQISTTDHTITNKIQITSSKSNLLIAGSYLFVGDDSGKIEVYSNDNLGDMHTNLDTQKDSVINKIMKSADNTKLYALTDSGIYAFDISNMPPGGGTIKTTNFFSFSDNLQSNDMEFTSTSPGMLYVDHGLAIYGFVLNDLTKKLWDTSSVILPNTMSPLTGSITSHILSADGSTIYFGTSDSLVYSYKTILSGVNSNSFYNIDSN